MSARIMLTDGANPVLVEITRSRGYNRFSGDMGITSICVNGQTFSVGDHIYWNDHNWSGQIRGIRRGLPRIPRSMRIWRWRGGRQNPHLSAAVFEEMLGSRSREVEINVKANPDEGAPIHPRFGDGQLYRLVPACGVVYSPTPDRKRITDRPPSELESMRMGRRA